MAERFSDRVSTYPNRRKLTIVSQSPYAIIADIERADEVINGQDGSVINANVLNSWDNDVQDSKKKSSDALKKVEGLQETPDVSQAGNVGTPIVEFITSSNGEKKFSFKNLKGAQGQPAGFGEITAKAVALQTGAEPYVNVSSSGENTAKNLAFDFGLPAGIKGDTGDNVYIRYSYDKTTMTEEPVDNSVYIGFYSGLTASENPSDYKWARLWGVKTITEADYKNLLSNNTVNNEQIYFVEGIDDNKITIEQSASLISYNNGNSGLKAKNVQEAVDEIRQRQSSISYNDLTNKPIIPTNSSFTLFGLGERSYNSLTEKPNIPTRLSELSEKSFNSLTDKPTIPTNASFTLSGLGEKSYDSLTNKPNIPTNASFTLAGLGERSYNSLTDKPTIPELSVTTIAEKLGLTIEQLNNLVELAKVTRITPDGISFDVNSINIK